MNEPAHAPTIDPRSELENVRRLVTAGESNFAALRAIELLAMPALSAAARGDAAQVRAELLNDLAVLRFKAGDGLSAVGLLQESLWMRPDDPLAGSNLADVRSTLPDGAEQSREGDWRESRPSDLGDFHPWEREAIDAARALTGIRGHRVLEVGGSVPAEVARGEGACRWVACDPRLPELASEGYERRTGSADALPFDDGTFDLVFSCCAFEHLPDLGGALAEALRVLRPGGAVFSQFSPIWSCAIGHHVRLEAEGLGVLGFHDPLFPHWGHLLLSRGALTSFLEYSLGTSGARSAVATIHDSAYLNRLFAADYVRAFERSGFEVRTLDPWGEAPAPGEELRVALERAWPEGGRFDVPGFRVVLRKRHE